MAAALCLAAPSLLTVAAAGPALADGAAIVITASATSPQFVFDSGTEPTVAGRIIDATGDGVPAVSVSLSWTDASHATPTVDDSNVTAGDGTFLLLPSPPSGNPDSFETRTYAVTHTDTDGSYATAVSPPVVIGVRARFDQITSSAGRIAPGNNFWALEGQVSGPAGSTILGQLRGADGAWSTVARSTTTAVRIDGSPVTRFFIHFPGRRNGSQVVRVVRPTDAYQDEVDSPASTVKYGWTPLLGKATSYSFVGPLVHGLPLHYDHCTYVTWAFNPAGAPDGALPVLKEVFYEAAHYSGYHFKFTGTTREAPGVADSRRRLSTGKGPEILVKWVKPSGETDFTRNIKGEAGLGGSAVGGSAAFPRRGGGALLLIQKPNGVDLSMDFAPDGWGAIALHELGNVLGLGQVRDKTQIMNPGATLASQYGAGDAAGLARLGHVKGCGGG